jgi:hypothetical protein
MLDRSIVVGSTSFKNVGKLGLPVGHISFSRLPNLFRVLVDFLKVCQVQKRHLLFKVDGLAPSVFLSNCLHRLDTFFAIKIPLFQGHSLKRGTVSILKKCGVSVENLNLHVGWSLTSSMFASYLRFVLVKPVDLLFFHDVLSLEAGL